MKPLISISMDLYLDITNNQDQTTQNEQSDLESTPQHRVALDGLELFYFIIIFSFFFNFYNNLFFLFALILVFEADKH